MSFSLWIMTIFIHINHHHHHHHPPHLIHHQTPSHHLTAVFGVARAILLLLIHTTANWICIFHSGKTWLERGKNKNRNLIKDRSERKLNKDELGTLPFDFSHGETGEIYVCKARIHLHTTRKRGTEGVLINYREGFMLFCAYCIYAYSRIKMTANKKEPAMLKLLNKLCALFSVRANWNYYYYYIPSVWWWWW